MPNKSHHITLANGNLYLDYTIYNTYFPSISSIILLNQPPLFLIMPVQQQGAGGLLLKIRNIKGDRVVNVGEFFLNLNINITEKNIIPVEWNTTYAALTFSLKNMT